MATHKRHFLKRPSAAEAELAAAGSRALAACAGLGELVTLRVNENDTVLTVPIDAIKMLAEILEQIAQGNAISIVSIHRELTTQEAADILNISRPYLIQQVLDQGKIPFHRAGNRRKIYFKDVLAYKRRQEKATDQIMAELASLSQSLDIMDRSN